MIRTDKYGYVLPRINTGKYPCSVGNCGNGECVHDWIPYRCPECGHQMVQVAPTGFLFCSNHEMVCEFEGEPDKILSLLIGID